MIGPKPAATKWRNDVAMGARIEARFRTPSHEVAKGTSDVVRNSDCWLMAFRPVAPSGLGGRLRYVSTGWRPWLQHAVPSGLTPGRYVGAADLEGDVEATKWRNDVAMGASAHGLKLFGRGPSKSHRSWLRSIMVELSGQMIAIMVSSQITEQTDNAAGMTNTSQEGRA